MAKAFLPPLAASKSLIRKVPFVIQVGNERICMKSESEGKSFNDLIRDL